MVTASIIADIAADRLGARGWHRSPLGYIAMSLNISAEDLPTALGIREANAFAFTGGGKPVPMRMAFEIARYGQMLPNGDGNPDAKYSHLAAARTLLARNDSVFAANCSLHYDTNRNEKFRKFLGDLPHPAMEDTECLASAVAKLANLGAGDLGQVLGTNRRHGRNVLSGRECLDLNQWRMLWDEVMELRKEAVEVVVGLEAGVAVTDQGEVLGAAIVLILERAEKLEISFEEMADLLRRMARLYKDWFAMDLTTNHTPEAFL